jgi:hypothetical protein
MFSQFGEFIPQGSSMPIAGSDVKLLLEYILKSAPKRGKEPKGFDQFMKQFMDVEACRTPPPPLAHRRSERERRH